MRGMRRLTKTAGLLAVLLLASCSPRLNEEKPRLTFPKDVHSYANPGEAFVTHLDLLLRVDFEKKVLSGSVTHTVSGKGRLVLDSKNLTIFKTETSMDGQNFRSVEFISLSE